MNIAPGKPLPVLLTHTTAADLDRLRSLSGLLKTIARIESIEECQGQPPESAMALVGEMQLHIPLAGLIDINAELERIKRTIEQVQNQISKAESKLANENFVARAPEQVVAQERERLAKFKTEYAELREQRARIEKLG